MSVALGVVERALVVVLYGGWILFLTYIIISVYERNAYI
jgi:hypothetical protein